MSRALTLAPPNYALSPMFSRPYGWNRNGANQKDQCLLGCQVGCQTGQFDG